MQKVTAILKTILKASTFLFLLSIYTSPAYALDERPVSSNVSVSEDTVNLTEGTTTDVVITATVTDADGCEDISSVSVTFFRTDLGSSCSADDNDCYEGLATEDSGTCTPGGSDLNSTWTATISMQYFADPTDIGTHAGTTWSAEVIPSDSVGAGTTTGNYTVEVATLEAVSTVASINFGTMTLDENTGSSDQTTTVTNTGNAQIGLKVHGTDSENPGGGSYVLMRCDAGAILMKYAKYDTSSGTDYSLKTILTPTATIVSGFSIPQRTSDPTTDDLYWGFGVPDAGAGGSCEGTVVFTPYVI